MSSGGPQPTVPLVCWYMFTGVHLTQYIHVRSLQVTFYHVDECYVFPGSHIDQGTREVELQLHIDVCAQCTLLPRSTLPTAGAIPGL